MRLVLALALAALTGCVAVPVPPLDAAGMKAGQLGRLRLVLTAKWEPNWNGVIDAVLNKRQLPPPNGLTK